MATNEVVGIEIRAELAGLRADLAKIPDIGAKEARAMAGALSREIKRSERASKKAAEQAKKTAGALREQTRATKEVAKNTGGLTASLAKMGAGLAGVMLTAEKIKMAFTAVADAVYEITEQEPEIERFSDAWREVRDSVMVPLAATVTGIKGTTADLMDEMRRTDGFLTFSRAVRTAFYEVAIPAFGAAAQTVKVLWESLRALGRTMDRVGEVFSLKSRVIGKVLKGDFQGAADEVTDTVDSLMEIPEVFRDAGREIAASSMALQEWAESASETARGAEDSIRATSRLVQEQKFATEEVEEGSKTLVKAEEARQKAIKETVKVRRESAAEEQSIVSSLASTVINTAVSVSSSVIDAIQSMALSNVREARKRAEVELGLAILRGELQAAGAFGTTLATYGGTPQGFALAAAAAAAVGISSKAAAAAGFAQASEKFHSGGVYRAPDEGTATLRNGEGVLTPAAVRRIGGERGLDALNSSAQTMTNEMVVQFDGRLYDATVSESLSRRGSPLSRSLSALSRKTGTHRPHG